VRDGAVLRCIRLVRNAMCLTLCGWQYVGDGVGDGVGDAMWVTVCRSWCVRDGGSRCVGDGVGEGVGDGVGHAIWVTVCK